MRIELPSFDPNTAPPPVPRRGLFEPARYRPSRQPEHAPEESSHLRALPWMVVGLWAGAMLLGAYAEYLISRIFQ